LQAALFIFYLLVASVAIKVIPFFKNAGIKFSHLVSLFIIKVLAGVAYGRFYALPQNYPNADTWRFYHLSLHETKWLRRDPVSFINDLFTSGYSSTGNIFSSVNSYWNDLKSNVIIKTIAVFNIFTNNSYYTNIIFFNFLFLFGIVALYKILATLYPGRKLLVLCGLFLWPSTLFWCSGIHKDGLVLSATGLVFYSCFRLMTKRFSLKYLLIIVISCLTIFSVRNYVLLALLPAILCWLVSHYIPKRKATIFAALYFLLLVVVLFAPLIFPGVDLLTYIVNRRQEFLHLQAGSLVETTPLQPTPVGFISFLPNALDMAFLRPHLQEIKSVSYLAAIIENFILAGLIAAFVLIVRKVTEAPAVILCMVTFAISVLILCGYTIPISGAIVRYKSVVMPLLVTPLICLIDFSGFRKNRHY
jgi:hypothetical protein